MANSETALNLFSERARLAVRPAKISIDAATEFSSNGPLVENSPTSPRPIVARAALKVATMTRITAVASRSRRRALEALRSARVDLLAENAASGFDQLAEIRALVQLVGVRLLLDPRALSPDRVLDFSMHANADSSPSRDDSSTRSKQ